MGTQRIDVAPALTPTGVRFRLADAEARSVAVAGSFNDWSVSSHPLAREGTSNVWALIVPLQPGEHRFMFIVDGSRWITPPLADDFEDDGFGSRNGVVIVRSR
jgi:1,4-alpha-glucan branching enzyme